MKMMTEYRRTMNGTCSDEAPLTRKRTIGANRTSMILTYPSVPAESSPQF
jgi:hypothetical protein